MGLGEEAGELFRDARAGVPGARRALHRVCGRYVRAVARAKGRRRDLDDVIQDVFFAVQEALREGGPTVSDFRAWLRGVILHVATDHHRKAARNRWSPLPEDLADPAAADPADAAARAERAGVIRECIARLPEDMAEVVALAHLEEQLGHRELALRLGIPPRAVNMRLHRGRMLLRAWLRPFAE